MDPIRRTRLLRALDIDVFRPRGVTTAAELADAVLPVAAASTPIAHEPAGAGLASFMAARQAPRAPATAPAPIAEVAAPPLPDAIPDTMPYHAPADWPGLAAAVSDCQRCKLCKTRTKTVFGVGPQDAPLLVVGEGPGADEDAQGEPFVGRAGKLLDEMLKSIGRTRAGNTYIANVVKCRPPGNRDPEADEVAACRPYLDRQIDLIRPKLIVALGRIAAQRLLSTDAPLSKLRGPLYEYGAAKTPVLITYHPAYLLRSPGEKAKSWQDLKRVHRFLAEAN